MYVGSIFTKQFGLLHVQLARNLTTRLIGFLHCLHLIVDAKGTNSVEVHHDI